LVARSDCRARRVSRISRRRYRRVSAQAAQQAGRDAVVVWSLSAGSGASSPVDV
jgi:hypothetical protein